MEQFDIGREFEGVIVAPRLPFLLNYEGMEFALSAQARVMLGYLMDNSGRVIPKIEVAQHLWPNTKITSGLSRYAREIREGLEILMSDGDDGFKPWHVPFDANQRMSLRFYARVRNIVPGSIAAQIVEERVLKFEERGKIKYPRGRKPRYRSLHLPQNIIG